MNIKNMLCCAVVLSTLVFSNVSALEISLGVKGGVNLTNFYGAEEEYGLDPYENQKVKPGIAAGAALQLKLANMFAIEPEVLFSQKGQKASSNGSSEILYINYLELPVLAQFLIPVPVVTPIIYMGPAFDFKVGEIDGKTEYSSGLSVTMTDNERKALDKNFSGFDLGLALGGGAEIKAGPGKVVFDVRYTLGLVKVYKLTDYLKDIGITESDLPKDKNGALMFAAGYLFAF